MARTLTSKVHFPGLNGLRFFAALLVLVGHAPLNQESVGLPHPSGAAFFFRAFPAVCFFFTLSGFLITYLLLEERRRTGDVDVRAFYVRRMCRIWPLYFTIIVFGLVFYNLVLPGVGIAYRVEYPLWLAGLLYVVFLPNLMNSLYTVGGILNPTWSIGVEEHFYLSWAPLVRRWAHRLVTICVAALLASLALYLATLQGVFGNDRLANFLGQLRFHFMAAGGLAAVALHRAPRRLLGLAVFRHRGVQLVVWASILEFVFVGAVPWTPRQTELIQLLLYPWLILNVAANPRNVLRVENRALEYLGTISYGIYMYHMVAIYTTSQLFRSTAFWRDNLVLYLVTYYGLAIGLTVLLAHVSYRLLERPFLRRKRNSLASGSREALIGVDGDPLGASSPT